MPVTVMAIGVAPIGLPHPTRVGVVVRLAALYQRAPHVRQRCVGAELPHTDGRAPGFAVLSTDLARTRRWRRLSLTPARNAVVVPPDRAVPYVHGDTSRGGPDRRRSGGNFTGRPEIVASPRPPRTPAAMADQVLTYTELRRYIL